MYSEKFHSVHDYIAPAFGEEFHPAPVEAPQYAHKYGIKRNWLANQRNTALILPAELEHLQPLEALATAHDQVWLRIRGEHLPHPIAVFVYGMAYLHNPDVAASTLQRAINDQLRNKTPLVIDGIIGEHTLAEIDRHRLDNLVEEYFGHMVDFHDNLGDWSEPYFPQWDDYTSDVYTEALRLARASIHAPSPGAAAQIERPDIQIPAFQFIRPKRPIDRVFIHCTASSRPEHDNIETIRGWHLDRGWSDVGYHFMIHRDGKISAGRDIEQTPAAQKGHNTGTIAVSLHGGQHGQDDFSPEQRQALVMFCDAIDNAYDGNVTFHGHEEVANKACPVLDYRTLLHLGTQGHMLRQHAKLENSRTIRTGRTGMATSTIGASGLTVATALEVAKNARSTADEVSTNLDWLFAQPLYVWIIFGAIILFAAHSLYFGRINFFRKQDHERGYK